MSRQEDFIDAGIEYRFKQGKPMAIGGDNFAEMTHEMNRTKPFEAGCEHGYQYAVDKACEWIKKNVLEFEHQSFGHEFDDCVEDFRKAMEE